MIGILLIATSQFFNEIGTSIGKDSFGKGTQSIYTMGFLSLFWGTVAFFAIAFFIRGEFLFSLASLPTFLPRVVLELVQAHVTMLAIAHADRSTFGFIRIWTIPLLLMVDVSLGYTIGFTQMAGIGLIVLSFVVLFTTKGIGKKGMWFVIFTTINAVVTLSLFKYNITNFNSVEAEQGIITLVVVIYFFIMAVFIAKENPFSLMRRPAFFIQSLTHGIGHVILSFAYLFAPASVITSAKRSFSVLWATLSGNIYFKEKKLIVKLISFSLIIAGLVLLIL